MGKKGKGKYFQVQEEMPKKKTMITEQQLMDKTHMDKTEFIPMLPQQSMYQPYIFNDVNEAAIAKIVSDLNYLLYANFKEFWATVLYNPTLKRCLSSCLTYLHRRWMNTYQYSKQSKEQFEADEKHREIYRRVFLQPVGQHTFGLMQVLICIFHRVVSFYQENKQLSILYKLGQQISRKYILDIPRLFQLCQIYGEMNPEIVRYIVKMYINTVPDFYKALTSEILPIIFKKVEDSIRFTKNLTDREQYGINYSYKRLSGEKLSQGEQELKRKILILMQFVSFISLIKNIIKYFPQDCVENCYFNSQVQFCFQNIFFELEVAYKVWNYQTQDVKILAIINSILKQCVQYFTSYFDRCNQVFVLQTKKGQIQAYLNSLQRICKDFGRRMTVSKKNQTRNLLMYKIVQKQFDFHSMLHSIYRNEVQQNGFGFNLEYLKEIIIAFDSQFKQEYINEDEPRQEEVEEETQAGQDMQINQIDDVQKKQGEQLQPKVQTEKKEDDLQNLDVLVPKRMRSQDYYHKLYADFNKKFYKGQYEDDYDDITDFDKRPMFIDEEPSSSQSESQIEKRLVTNNENLERINSMHNRHTINRNQARNKNVNQPKYTKVQTNKPQPYHPPTGGKKYVQKGEGEEKEKKKYVLKQELKVEPAIQKDKQVERFQPQQRVQYRQRQEETPQKRGGQGYKKNNKSFNYKPKEHHDNNYKGRNANKNKDSNQTRYK